MRREKNKDYVWDGHKRKKTEQNEENKNSGRFKIRGNIKRKRRDQENEKE